MSLRLVSFSLLLGAGVALAQEPTPTPGAEQVPTFSAEVELVTVDVVVTDKKRNPISGLTLESFTLTEDGKPQEITSFEAVELPAEPAPAPPTRFPVSTNLRTERNPWTGRLFAIVFDDLHLTLRQANRAKNAVAEFLTQGVRAGDRVTLIATGAEVWWTAEMPEGRDELMKHLDRLEGRRIPYVGRDALSDYEAMQIFVHHDPLVINRVMRRWDTWGVSTENVPELASGGSANPFRTDADALLQPRAAETYNAAATRSRVTLGALTRLLGSLEGAKGRKAAIVVSPGFIHDPSVRGFKDALEASRRSNTAIYFLDTRGLTGLTEHFRLDSSQPLPVQDYGAAFVEGLEAAAGAEHVAVDSGGFVVKNRNDLGEGIRRIANESRTYYLLGYYPSNVARDGEFRKIEVDVARDGVRVRARKGYYATPESELPPETLPEGTDPKMQKAADAPFDLEDVPLRMSSYVFEETLLGRARVLMATEVDIRDLAFREEDGRAVDTLDYAVVISHLDSGEMSLDSQHAELKLLPETRRQYEKSWFLIAREFELTPGSYQAKVVVRDSNDGKIGTLLHRFEVPSLASLRISTPILSDTLLQAQEGQRKTPVPTVLARRTFSAKGVLFHQYSVHGAARDEASGSPRVRAAFEIRRSDGEVYYRAKPTLITPTSLGHLTRVTGTRLSGAAPGDYELILNLTDEVTGQSLEAREPFILMGVEG